MGNTDRVIRIIIASILVVLFFTHVISGVAGYILLGIGSIFVLTSVVSFCPIYSLFGMKTCAMKKTVTY